MQAAQRSVGRHLQTIIETAMGTPVRDITPEMRARHDIEGLFRQLGIELVRPEPAVSAPTTMVGLFTTSGY